MDKIIEKIVNKELLLKIGNLIYCIHILHKV